ncbi:Rap1a/Tai family immunity protein [Roseobacter litoralis]|uniref:Rap1a/Tai family immunity protein n=1 Tax=Roseobacter litoralis TaxID=42443 RepID=UPI003CCAC714
MLSACEAQSDVQLGVCVGYIIGTWEGIKIGGFQTTLPAFEGKTATEVDYFVNRILGVCVPAGVENGQIKDVVVGHLQNSPTTRHNSARTLLLESLIGAFPCR